MREADLMHRGALPTDPVIYQKILHYTATKEPPRATVSEQLEIAMVLSGQGIHRFFDHDIPCKSGDIYITPQSVPHCFIGTSPDEPMTVRFLYLCPDEWFDDEVATPGAPRYCYGAFHDNAATAYAMLNTETRSLVTDLLDNIALELGSHRPEWQDAVRSHLTLLLITVGRYVSNAIQNIPRIRTKEWQASVIVLHAINERFGDSTLTLERIADELYISKSHLSRLFRRLSGKPFSEHLKEVRLEHACKLLQETALTVEEIVPLCGLRDLASFYAGFQAYMGMTPSRYRSLHTIDKKDKNIKGDKIMVILSEISEYLQKGKSKLVKEMVQQALDEGSNPEQILNEGLLAGMNVIGEKFKNNEIYVPEVLVAARAMNMGVQVLKPHLVAQGVQATGKVCLGTVQGDLHDIGKNLVKMMMEGKGLEVVDLGTDVPAEAFVQTAIEQNCNVICCSALLTTTMGVMGDVVKAAEAAGVRDKIKIMVGGAPVSEAFCREIGADCYTVDAASAADAAFALCNA